MPLAWLFRIGWILLTVVGIRRARQAAKTEVLPRSVQRRVRLRVARAKEATSLVARTIGVVIGAGFSVVATTAAATLAVSGPRWLAAVFGIAAVVAVVLTLKELLTVRRDVRYWRRRHERELTIREVDADSSDDSGVR